MRVRQRKVVSVHRYIIKVTTDLASCWTAMMDSASTMCSCWSGKCTVGLLRTTTLSALRMPACSQESTLVGVCTCVWYGHMLTLET